MINYIWAITYCEYLYKTGTDKAQVTILHWACTGTDPDTDNFARRVGTEDATGEDYEKDAATIDQTAQSVLLDLLFDVMGPEKLVIEANIKNEVELLNNPTGGGFTPP